MAASCGELSNKKHALASPLANQPSILISIEKVAKLEPKTEEGRRINIDIYEVARNERLHGVLGGLETKALKRLILRISKVLRNSKRPMTLWLNARMQKQMISWKRMMKPLILRMKRARRTTL
jgi:hypothetical protein